MKIGKTNATNAKNTTQSKKVFELIPKGQYLAFLDRIQEKETKNGDGKYVECSFKIAEGDNKNRLVFHKFMLEHSNPKVVEIGLDQLDKFVKVLGIREGLEGIDYDTAELDKFKGKIVGVNVGIQKGTNGYNDNNKISSFAKR